MEESGERMDETLTDKAKTNLKKKLKTPSKTQNTVI